MIRRHIALPPLLALAFAACSGTTPTSEFDAGLGPTNPGDASLDNTGPSPGDVILAPAWEGGDVSAAGPCVAKTCADYGANCGPMGDGCGGLLQCGSCTGAETCGGGGKPSVCGGAAQCIPTTCANLGIKCGPAGDGCGNLLDCGNCGNGESCGGSGVHGQCGTSLACSPRTCADVGANCGYISDGCGGALNCGTCTGGQTCGGAGTHNECGGGIAADASNPCVPSTCQSQGVECGPAGDGCGNLLSNCGTCAAPQTCGGGGQPGKCGGTSGCIPKTCTDHNANCGPVDDGCGGILNCGTCTPPQTCGGGGTPSRCGGAGVCVPKTCGQLGKTCGPVGDGCGGLIASCGTCASPQICGGGGIPSVCGPTDAAALGCTGLCQQQVACASGTTTVTGVVYNPAGTSPIYGALVYVPNGTVSSITDGVASGSCDQCGTLASGSPLVSATTGPDGSFTLTNMPVGANIPLVIQLGKWRRQTTISNVPQCTTTNISANCTGSASNRTNCPTRLPRNKTEGNIPKIAMSTGNWDAIECVLRKIGIDDSEFTNPSGTGRIKMYYGHASDGDKAPVINANTPSRESLLTSPTTLEGYDMVILACEGWEDANESSTHKLNLKNYTTKGGRVYTSHFGYKYLYNYSPFSTTATWNVGGTGNGGEDSPMTVTVDQSFTKGKALAQWLQNIGASATYGSAEVDIWRHNVNSVASNAQRWLYATSPLTQTQTIQHYTFNTPVGADASTQCGRVIFSDFHVSAADVDVSNTTFPAECDNNAMTAQEKMLEFMLFDLASCIVPTSAPTPTCTPATCQSYNYDCGYAGDGCGGAINCGTCVAPATCGGGGQPNRCAASSCVPRSCQAQSIECGPAGDGCGEQIDCGTCPPGQTCGGGGVHGKCGAPSCTPRSCQAQGFECGYAGDGCGKALNCGTCPPGQACGAGGAPGRCGAPDSAACMPQNCADQKFECGLAGDGCGDQIDCGPCPPGQTCGAGGPNKCGGCAPKSCSAQGFECGPAGDGCGNVIQCGDCPPGQTCGGGGVPGRCGAPSCKPLTCTEQGYECGLAGDGCGNQVDCGPCPPGQTCGGGGVAWRCGAPGTVPK